MAEDECLPGYAFTETGYAVHATIWHICGPVWVIITTYCVMGEMWLRHLHTQFTEILS